MHASSTRLGALTVGITLALAGPAALAQDDDVLVIGQRLEETLPQELSRYGNRLETVDNATLKIGGFNDISQALQMTAPGFYVAPFSGPFDYMHCSLQGSRCQDILFLVDGVRISNRLYDTTMPLDTLPAHAIERIEVLSGGQGLFYGTQSAAGVVNIVTSSFRGEPTGNVTMGADDNGGTHLSGDFRTGGNGHSVVLFASSDEADGFQPIRDSDYQVSATDRERGYEVLSVGVKYGYDFSDASRLSLLYQHNDNEVDYMLAHQIRERYNARDEDLLTVKWDYSFGDNAALFIKGYMHDWDTRWTDIRNTLSGGVMTGGQTVLFEDAYWGYEDYGITALAELGGGPVEYSVGYDFQNFWGNDEVWAIEDKTEEAHAIYGQIRSSATALENSAVAFGVRYNTTSGSADGTVWTLSGQHNLSDSLYLRGQVGTSFRLPDAEELYVNDCCEQGNPNLESEDSENLEVGLGGSAGRANWQLIYFTRDIDNFIAVVCCDDPNFPDGRFENTPGTLAVDGFEAVFDVRLAESLSLSFNYSSTDANLLDLAPTDPVRTALCGCTSSDQYNRIPEDFIKAGLKYRPAMGPVELDLSLLNVGDVYDKPHSSLPRTQYGSYTVADIGVAVYFDNDRKHRLGFRIENAFDEEYTTALLGGSNRARRDVDNTAYVAGYLGSPRTINATYSYRW